MAPKRQANAGAKSGQQPKATDKGVQLLHSLQAGSAATKTFQLSDSTDTELYVEVSPQGNMLVAYMQGYVCVSKLVAGPGPWLEHLASVPTPQPEQGSPGEEVPGEESPGEGSMGGCFVAAVWAPDSSAILLRYNKHCGGWMGDADDPESSCQPSQAVYMLELETKQLKEIASKATYNGVLLCDPVFSSNSKRVLVPWKQGDEMEPCVDFEVFQRTGKHVASFTEHDASFVSTGQPSLALCKGSRVAVANRYHFTVFALNSGAQLGSRGPPPGCSPNYSAEGAGVICASRKGAWLAFCAVQPRAVQVYDALTLDLLSCLPLAASVVPGYSDLLSISCGPYGLALLDQGVRRVSPCALCVARPQSGSELNSKINSEGVQQVLCIPEQAPHPPAISPDGAYVATFEARDATLRVHDTQAGQLVCSQATGFKHMQGRSAVESNVALWWSSCGRRVWVRGMGSIVECVSDGSEAGRASADSEEEEWPGLYEPEREARVALVQQLFLVHV